MALAGAEDVGVNLSQLAEEQGVAASVYYAPIRDLIETGLVEKVPRVPGERRRWYRRRRHGFWEHAPRLLGELAVAGMVGEGS